MKVFMIVCFVLILTSCGGEGSPKERFIQLSCDVYELDECGFSESTRDFCEEFTSAIYDGNTPENPELCNDCLESLGCEMWTHGEKCDVECE